MFKHIRCMCVRHTLFVCNRAGLSSNKAIRVTCLCTCISTLGGGLMQKQAPCASCQAQRHSMKNLLTAVSSASPRKPDFPTLILTHIPQPPHRSSSASHQMTSKCIMGCQKTSKREKGAPAVNNTSNDWATHAFLPPFTPLLPFLYPPKTNI